VQAGIGQDCQRGVDIAPGVLKALGMPELTIINGDTESSVDTDRAHAEKLDRRRRAALIGAFDSGQTTAPCPGHRTKGHPAGHQYRQRHPKSPSRATSFVVRNFPTAPMLLNDELNSQKEIFALAGVAPKTAVFYARQRFVWHSDVARLPRHDAEVRFAVYDRR